MGHELNVEILLLKIVTALVDDENEVRIEALATEKGTMIRLSVSPTDVGKIIGKQGRTARAIRELLLAIGTANRQRYELNIIETRLGSDRARTTTER
jgi:hypothetical protein